MVGNGEAARGDACSRWGEGQTEVGEESLEPRDDTSEWDRILGSVDTRPL